MRPSHITCSATIHSTLRSSRLETDPREAGDGTEAVVEVSVDSGPGCTGRMALGIGRYVIGRSPGAHIRIADERLGLHHVVLDVGESSTTVTQLSGQAPIRVDGEPITGTRTIGLPARLSLGMNDLQIGSARRDENRVAPGSIVAANDPCSRIVQRGPDQPTMSARDAIAPPPLPVDGQRVPPATALIGAGAGVLSASVLALLLGQVMFALVAALGAAASAATWLLGVVSAWRCHRRSCRVADHDRQRFLDELAAARRVARQRHEAEYSDLGETIAIADSLAVPLPLRSDVWQRRLHSSESHDGSAGDVTFRPVIGRGTSRWSPQFTGDVSAECVADIECAATIDDVPIPVLLACGELTVISGAPTERAAVLRSILCQIAVGHGPTDWQLVIVSSAREMWAWANWLPHGHTSLGTALIADPADPVELATVLALADGPADRPTLLVVDDPALLAMRVGVLRRFVERVRPATLTAAHVGTPLPSVCTALIEIGSTGAVMLARLDGTRCELADAASSIRMCGLSEERAAGVARSLAGLVDPVDGQALGRRDGQALDESPSSQRGPFPYWSASSFAL